MATFKINDGVVIDYTNDGWAEFSNWINGTYATLALSWVDEGLAYNIILFDNRVYRVCSINKGTGEALEFETLYKRNVSNAAPVTDDHRARVQVDIPEGRRCDVYTPNFCDRTTWYSDSLRVEAAGMVDSGDHQTYALPIPCYVADVKHGKIFGEDNLLEDYGAVVTVDAVAKVEHSPGMTNGDYLLDYVTGAVTFKTPLAGTEVVTMSYSKVRTSLCKINPPDGQKMRVGYVEVQFAKNIGLTDTLIFQLWGDVGYGMMPLSGMEKYKTMRDFITDAEKAYPLIPVFTGAGNTWRMLTEETSIFRFDYTLRASTDLLSSLKMEIRVWLENDIPYAGDYAVGTFYGTRVTE
jgi:hypothetical protein